MSINTAPGIGPGTILLSPHHGGDRARDVLCIFDVDAAYYALIVNQPTDQPAQPLTFSN